MFRLVRLLLGLIFLGVVVYVAVVVPLGRRTLWQHVRAIAGSKESQELVEEVREKAGHMLHHDAGATRRAESAEKKESGDELTAKERRLLRKLIKEKLGDGAGKK